MKGLEKVKTAVIGCGAISRIYIENMATSFEILELVGCCDRNTQLAKETADAYGIRAMSMEEILDSPEIEIVVNLTNPAAHYEVIKTLLEHGKHVYTEKVLAADIAEARELLELAGEKKRLLCSAPDTCLGAAVQTARYLVDTGLIGSVTSAVAVLQRDAGLLAEKYPYTSKRGGGIGIDVGIYYTTAMINILGEVEQVCGMSGVFEPEKRHYFTKNDNFGEKYIQEAETYLSGTLQFKNGCIGTLHFNSRSIRTEKPYVAFYGTQGILFLEDPNCFGGDVKVVMKGQTEPLAFPSTHGYSGNCRGLGVAEMAWALRMGRTPRTNSDMALHALEILTGIAESGESRTFYKLCSGFKRQPGLPRGYLGEEYAQSQPEGGLYFDAIS